MCWPAIDTNKIRTKYGQNTEYLWGMIDGTEHVFDSVVPYKYNNLLPVLSDKGEILQFCTSHRWNLLKCVYVIISNNFNSVNSAF